MFFFETFLQKIADSPFRLNFVLKGGFLLSSIIGIESRSTMDIDISIRNQSFDEDSIRQIIKTIITTKTKNEVIFELKTVFPIKEHDDYKGYRVSLVGKLQNIKQPFNIDIATGDPITPKEIEYCYNSVFDNKNIIKIYAYNLETIIAEKLETIISKKTNNSRSKDFYDLYIIKKLKMNKIDVAILNRAIKATFEYRNTPFAKDAIILDLENILHDSSYQKYWKLYAKKNIYAEEIMFEDIVFAIEDLVNLIKQDSPIII